MKVSLEQFIKDFAKAIELPESEAGKITPGTELASLAYWDSIAIITLIIAIDVEYSKKIFVDRLKECKTISDIYSAIF